MAAELADRVYDMVAQEIGTRSPHSGRLNRLEQQALVGELVADAFDRIAAERTRDALPAITSDEEERTADEVLARMFGLGAIERLLADENVENININGCDTVWLHEAGGSKRRGPSVARSDEELVELIRRAAARLGRTERRFDTAHPFLDLQLPDGSRLNAVMAVSGRPSVSIRRHRHEQVALSDLVTLGSMDEALCEFLQAAVAARLSIIVCGGTNAGKTTLLRALINACDPSERLITIEDRLELNLGADPQQHNDVIELETRNANIEGAGEITMQQLVRNALAMSPDRLIVGEVRGAEVVDMLGALSTGNDGSMCTIHSSSSKAAFSKIGTYALRSTERVPVEATNRMIAESINFVVHVHKNWQGLRLLGSVREVTGCTEDGVLSNEIFAPDQDGRACPASSLQDATRAKLSDVGFDHSLLLSNGWWDQ